MTLRDFNLRILRDEILGRLLPLELRRTDPLFRLDGEVLLAAFIGFRIKPEGNAVKLSPPAYYLEITYPQCTLQSFERLPFSQNPELSGQMTPRKPEDIKRLSVLCDEVLRLYDEKSGCLDAAIAEYHAQLMEILEPEQIAALERGRRI